MIRYWKKLNGFVLSLSKHRDASRTYLGIEMTCSLVKLTTITMTQKVYSFIINSESVQARE
jgi:hypothetical protein